MTKESAEGVRIEAATIEKNEAPLRADRPWLLRRLDKGTRWRIALHTPRRFRRKILAEARHFGGFVRPGRLRLSRSLAVSFSSQRGLPFALEKTARLASHKDSADDPKCNHGGFVEPKTEAHQQKRKNHENYRERREEILREEGLLLTPLDLQNFDLADQLFRRIG